FMEIRTWAENAQAKLTSIFSPAYLASQGKNTLRELTDVEADDLEDLKLRVLASLTPNQEVTQEAAVAALASLTLPAPLHELLSTTANKYKEKNGKEPPVDLRRSWQSTAIALWNVPVGDDAEAA